MKKLLIISLLQFFTIISRAASLPQSKEEYCKRFSDLDIMTNYSNESNNLMTFKNQGGLFNGGVCWWHSRFQRNVLYLTIFKPELPKASQKEIKALIKEIRYGKTIVTIPGFKNFKEFSSTYKTLILKELEDWQVYDGVVLGAWINGLKGETKIPSGALLTKMDELYQYVEIDKKLAYLKLQMKGITAHAWLVIGIKRSPAGYEIGIVDSNNPTMSESYSYKIGDESFFQKGYGHFVPYLEFTREEQRISSVGKQFCDYEVEQSFDGSQYKKDYDADLRDILKDKKLNN